MEDWELRDIESFRDSGIAPVMPILQKGLFHRTSINGYRGIMESGFIVPNTGQFEYTYPQSKFYFSHRKGYVCLFDFESSREKDYRTNHLTWAQFFTDQKPVTVILKLNRKELAEKLIPNSAGPKGLEPGNQFIPYVEAWYPEPIPVSSIESLIISFWNSDSYRTEFLEFTKAEMDEFENYIIFFEQLELRRRDGSLDEVLDDLRKLADDRTFS